MLRALKWLLGLVRPAPTTQAELSRRVFANKPAQPFDQNIIYSVCKGRVDKMRKVS